MRQIARRRWRENLSQGSESERSGFGNKVKKGYRMKGRVFKSRVLSDEDYQDLSISEEQE